MKQSQIKNLWFGQGKHREFKNEIGMGTLCVDLITSLCTHNVPHCAGKMAYKTSLKTGNLKICQTNRELRLTMS